MLSPLPASQDGTSLGVIVTKWMKKESQRGQWGTVGGELPALEGCFQAMEG